MLTLTRAVGEKIWIGESVSLTVIEVSGDKVRIGIEAPRDVQVHRAELLPEGHRLHPTTTTAAKKEGESPS